MSKNIDSEIERHFCGAAPMTAPSDTALPPLANKLDLAGRTRAIELEEYGYDSEEFAWMLAERERQLREALSALAALTEDALQMADHASLAKKLAEALEPFTQTSMSGSKTGGEEWIGWQSVPSGYAYKIKDQARQAVAEALEKGLLTR